MDAALEDAARCTDPTGLAQKLIQIRIQAISRLMNTAKSARLQRTFAEVAALRIENSSLRAENESLKILNLNSRAIQPTESPAAMLARLTKQFENEEKQ